MSIATVTLRISGAQLMYSDQHDSLLDALESQRVKVEYQCRSGYCGSCRLRLLKGKVVYRETPLACLQQDEILPCCCRPLDDIELDM
ncbi:MULTISPECIES: class I ribonucleotide reductase maintenance protein YfaE [Musicola]|uniref:Ferredoxin n=1 Tax=Musicola paradisiaca (strain Ech703) TaxID=579405 RepID=C6CBQ5_MUSP7|nr:MULTISPECIES: class I ribonucleotide reductase maintenance protein YfaE [Musicola]ACS84840.1 ferredoxin [Musicola paradisiaca Ech703]